MKSDRHWQRLAWEVNSRIALGNLDLPRAQDCLAKASIIVQEPLRESFLSAPAVAQILK